jgi:ADP-ribosyltransferase exoenzyme
VTARIDQLVAPSFQSPPPTGYDPRGFAVGVLTTQGLAEQGIRLQEWRWRYGPAMRENPYPKHRELDGRFVTLEGTLDGFYPGDHKGCLCSVVPVYATGDPSRVMSREEVDKLRTVGPATPGGQPSPAQFFRAGDNDDAQGWIARLADDLGQGDVTPDGPSDVPWATAMRQYTQTGRNAGYTKVNGALRAGKELKGATRKIADGMDQAIDQTRLTDNATLFRGVDEGAAELMDLFDSGDIVGKTLTDKAYQSTSMDLESASGLLDNEGGMMMEIRAPRGTGAAIGSRDEAELILGRDTQMRIVEAGVRQVEWLGEVVERRYVVAEIV